MVSVQSSHPAGTSITTSNQNGEVWGYRFTHWTINGVRQQAGAGFAVSQVTFNLAGNTVAQANFIATTQDLDSDQIPDWYEIQQYGSTTNGPDSDTDGDGVVFYDEYVKGTQPLIHDSAAAGGILEGGTSRRRGASTVVDLSLLLEDFSLGYEHDAGVEHTRQGGGTDLHLHGHWDRGDSEFGFRGSVGGRQVRGLDYPSDGF